MRIVAEPKTCYVTDSPEYAYCDIDEKDNYYVIPAENIIVNTERYSDTAIPFLFYFAEHSSAGEEHEENIGVIVYMEAYDPEESDFLKECVLKHPYFIERNTYMLHQEESMRVLQEETDWKDDEDDNKEKRKEWREENSIFRITIENFWEEVDPWQAFVTGAVEIKVFEASI